MFMGFSFHFCKAPQVHPVPVREERVSQFKQTADGEPRTACGLVPSGVNRRAAAVPRLQLRVPHDSGGKKSGKREVNKRQ